MPVDHATPQPIKRAAPISASAFTFSVDSPSSSSRKKVKPLGAVGTFGLGSLGPIRSTPARSIDDTIGIKTEPQTPARKSILPTIDSLPSPLPTKTASRRLTSLIDESSPFRPSLKGKEKALNDGDEKPKAYIAASDLSAGLAIPLVNRVGELQDEDEGVGVSPRKKKGIRYTGRGPPPLSMQLQVVVQSTNSSLLLFYTSMQKTLFPTRIPTPRRPSAVSQPPVVPVSALKHLRTAPMHLMVKSVVEGRTYQGVMMWCRLVDAVHAQPTLPMSQEADDDDIKANLTEDQQTRDVLVVFQPVPNECPRLGIDPRLVLSRFTNGQKWEVGIWEPSTEVDMPFDPADVRDGSAVVVISGEVVDKDREDEMEGVEGGIVEGEGATEKAGGRGRTKVMFATRYLLAEDKE